MNIIEDMLKDMARRSELFDAATTLKEDVLDSFEVDYRSETSYGKRLDRIAKLCEEKEMCDEALNAALSTALSVFLHNGICEEAWFWFDRVAKITEAAYLSNEIIKKHFSWDVEDSEKLDSD